MSSCNSAAAVPEVARSRRPPNCVYTVYNGCTTCVQLYNRCTTFQIPWKMRDHWASARSEVISDANGPPNPQFSLRKPWVLKSHSDKLACMGDYARRTVATRHENSIHNIHLKHLLWNGKYIIVSCVVDTIFCMLWSLRHEFKIFVSRSLEVQFAELEQFSVKTWKSIWSAIAMAILRGQ